ncbi:Na+/H+ antiporter Mnh2 subunit E [Staphylococcus sp. EG-SA-6]|jgi:multicomponent Na+:H+ antiporter subunit E|uniref:Putative antiporter subunit mnhE2 n=3 Tax=Staphylococcus TaxID=1279 RepID=MNHE2_STAHJ|nr:MULTISPECIES: Na+/H+ antiporter Mnh2 subunit E [Staphylococcus]Q4L447.1 RecName: Full=Putative antiporter subunit mnhE2; AltName: Full=Mrp complex subunit E2; AltName: Full=Putative NADH-ubiquinone oxidoreductase subunit mnhE2 [Staphylococcus haemolyticus JCSC1435]KDP51039.1 Na+/H+ ion antiporter subunit [Staphylococcus aureus subsp. aureus CO-98]MBN4934821.1 Na+/H+ antiporter Mnh2 subunit E [Staphylococcus sp. EG-SA-6]MDU2098203.1 Na+/H+ antiporter Mnh2 subunit E [Staphylococcus sp.]SIJ929
MRQVVLNILIAFLWVLFQDEDSFQFSTFVSGFIIGLIVIYILHRFFGQAFYPKKIWIAIKFLGVYLYQLITSSISIINYILFKTRHMNPGLLTYETNLKNDWAITFLTILIIITPGSTVIRISKTTNKFFIHSIDVSEKEKESLLKSIKQYENLITEVSQ